jgi:hypothetical protein
MGNLGTFSAVHGVAVVLWRDYYEGLLVPYPHRRHLIKLKCAASLASKELLWRE